MRGDYPTVEQRYDDKVRMGCRSSKCSEDGEHDVHVHSPTSISTKTELEETSFTESEAHAKMIIDVKGGQVESADCSKGVENTAERDPDEGKVEREETDNMLEIEAQQTDPIETIATTTTATTTTSDMMQSASGAPPIAKSVTISMAESKDARYWVQDLKG